MSELNKIAREYLESLGVEVPAVQDAAPKTFDTLVATGPKVKGWESANANGKPIIRNGRGPLTDNGRRLLTEDLRRNKVVPAPRQVTVTRAIPASAGIIQQHIRDVKAERMTSEEYKDAREMWDAINFQPLPIAAEEVVAPRAWRVWPTGSEVRVALMIAVFVLLGIAFLVTR